MNEAGTFTVGSPWWTLRSPAGRWSTSRAPTAGGDWRTRRCPGDDRNSGGAALAGSRGAARRCSAGGDGAPAGSVTFHHCPVLHGTSPNETGGARYGFIVNYMPEGVRYSGRPHPVLEEGRLAPLTPSPGPSSPSCGRRTPPRWPAPNRPRGGPASPLRRRRGRGRGRLLAARRPSGAEAPPRPPPRTARRRGAVRGAGGGERGPPGVAGEEDVDRVRAHQRGRPLPRRLGRRRPGGGVHQEGGLLGPPGPPVAADQLLEGGHLSRGRVVEGVDQQVAHVGVAGDAQQLRRQVGAEGRQGVLAPTVPLSRSR